MRKIKINPDVQTRKQPVDWLNLSPEIMQFLHGSGMITVDDVIQRQEEIPPDYLAYVKARLMGIDL